MIDTNTKQAIIDTYTNGIKVKNICALYNISLPTLYRFLQSAGVPKTRQTGDHSENMLYKAIAADSEKGLDAKTLSKKYDRCLQVIYRALRRNKVAPHRTPTPLMLNIRQSLKDGEPVASIAAKYGCSRQYVYLVRDASN